MFKADETYSVYTLSLRLGYPAAPNAVKLRQEVVTLKFFGEGDICFVAKELGEVVIARSEYPFSTDAVIDRLVPRRRTQR